MGPGIAHWLGQGAGRSAELQSIAIDSVGPCDLAVIRNNTRGASAVDQSIGIRGGVNVMTATTIAAGAPVSAAKPWYKVLYVQVLIAIVLGALVGWLWPGLATNDWI